MHALSYSDHFLSKIVALTNLASGSLNNFVPRWADTVFHAKFVRSVTLVGPQLDFHIDDYDYEWI